MTRVQMWDRVWARLESVGIPTNCIQSQDRSERDLPSGINVVAELNRLVADFRLPIGAIEVIGELVSAAYVLGLTDDILAEKRERESAANYSIPPMPAVNKPREASPTNCYGQVISGYIESIESQAQNNWPAIEWFLQNHEAIGEAVLVYNAARYRARLKEGS